MNIASHFAHQTPAGQGPFTKTMFAIETQKGATWDFGPVQWDQITIQASTTLSDWCYSPFNNSDFDYYLANPTVSVSGSQVICKFSSLILGDKTPPISPLSSPASSFIDAGPTTQSNILSLTEYPTPVVYHRISALPSPRIKLCDVPKSTLPNGFPDPSYSSNLAVESACNSGNSARMSSYSSALNEQLETEYGTITITTVDSDSALATLTTYDYIAAASFSGNSPPDGWLASVAANSTSGGGESIVITPLWLASWFISLSILVLVLAVCMFIFERRRQR
ncbi:hypothetical protein EYC84_009141 [Monilinia fructicola]|uniref:Uncharacterized protein n=1 Tax=Monilinia fructicola TaxID=38448 RepID=A0A5M9JHK4_MONFR|nr:hypothetical protein EYC84_009141 [Monilinia fructicola]